MADEKAQAHASAPTRRPRAAKRSAARKSSSEPRERPSGLSEARVREVVREELESFLTDPRREVQK